MGVNHGGLGERVPQNLEWGTLMQIVPLRFCHVSKYQTPDCLHYNAVMQYKAYQPHYFNVVFATSQKYIFNVHQITTSGGKFNIFFWQGDGQNYRL